MIPTAVLRQRVTIDRYTGTTGTGAPAFEEPITDVPARVVGKRRQIRTSTGVNMICDATIQLRPTITIPPQSLITEGDRVWTVVDCADAFDLNHLHHLDVFVEGPRPVAP